jgi:transposase-like protein
MSDRDRRFKLIAADDEIPRAHHPYCVEHIARNIKDHFTKFAREAFKKHLRNVKTEAEYQVELTALAAVDAALHTTC